ncbi:hypothetical protein [Lacticaseibacillus kribbianus]|uniref:hypothetical protein n=1 Tax=Lacticaseibacillus kribbianus TaxID=2926292 RepID=UPI001CD5AE4F|nr:hypothetical protein [Lacticaseibacillus kribbianus]
MRATIHLADLAIQKGGVLPAPYPLRLTGLSAPDWTAADFAGLSTDAIGGHQVTLSEGGLTRLRQANPTVAPASIAVVPGTMTVVPAVTPRTIALTRTITYVGAGAGTPPPLVQRLDVAVYQEISVAQPRVAYVPQGAFPAVPSPARFGFVPDRSVPAEAPQTGFRRPAHRFVTVSYLPNVIEYVLAPVDRNGVAIAEPQRVYGLQGQLITTYPDFAALERLPQPLRVPAKPGGRVAAIYVPADPWAPTPEAELQALAQRLMPDAAVRDAVADGPGLPVSDQATQQNEQGTAVPEVSARDSEPAAAAVSGAAPVPGAIDEPSLPLTVPAALVQPVHMSALLRRATRQLFGREALQDDVPQDDQDN